MRCGRGLVLVGVLLMASGCISPPLDENSLEGAIPAPTFVSHFIDETRSGKEPAVEIAADGTVYVCAPRGVGVRGTSFWRSTDNGTAFEFLGEPLPANGPIRRSITGDVGGGDCDIATDANGRVYMVDLWAGSASVLSSSDRGDTWRGVPISVLPGPVDRPWITGGDGDEVFVTASSGGQGIGLDQHELFLPPVGGLWVLRSTDGGLTFPQQRLAASNDHRLGLNSNLARNGDNLYLMYSKQLAEGRVAIMVAASHDRGLTWTQHVVVEQDYYVDQCFGPIQIFPVVEADSAGGVYLTWAFQNPATERIDLFFASSPDGGENWNAPVLVVDRPGTRLFPWMSVVAPGEVSIAWYDANETSLIDYRKDATGTLQLACERTMSDDAPWFLHHARVQNATAAQPTIEEIRVQAEPVHRGVLSDSFAEFLQVATGPDGRVGIAYVSDIEDGQTRPLFATSSDQDR